MSVSHASGDISGGRITATAGVVWTFGVEFLDTEEDEAPWESDGWTSSARSERDRGIVEIQIEMFG